MHFADTAKIYLKSGKGGNGCVSFYRAPHMPLGGPDGGNGGKGGDVTIQACAHKISLKDYRTKQHFKAQNGQNGMGRNRYGSNGEDITLKVPIGTQIFNQDETALLAELTQNGQVFLAAMGGKGGMGNVHFKSSTRRSPKDAQPGEPCEEVSLRLRLLIKSDVAIIGRPNSGKSTLLAKICKTKSTAQPWPHSTKDPTLGEVIWDYHQCVFMDTPPINNIEHFHHHLTKPFLILCMLQGKDPSNIENQMKETIGILKQYKIEDPKIFWVLNNYSPESAGPATRDHGELGGSLAAAGGGERGVVADLAVADHAGVGDADGERAVADVELGDKGGAFDAAANARGGERDGGSVAAAGGGESGVVAHTAGAHVLDYVGENFMVQVDVSREKIYDIDLEFDTLLSEIEKMFLSKKK